MDLLKFMFDSFWNFAGCAFILHILTSGIVRIIETLFNR